MWGHIHNTGRLYGTGFLNSCLPKAETGVSRPGVGQESSYSPARESNSSTGRSKGVVEVDPSPVLHPGSGGGQGGIGLEVGGCSTEGGTRQGGLCERHARHIYT